jgi:23S rRNA (pseudouridine1915-N3)-methyltransferase
MQFRLVVVGKVREKWLQQGIQEYSRRLGRHGKIFIEEVPDQPCPSGSFQQQQALQREGEQILARIRPRSYVIALDIKGRSLDSPGLAAMFHNLALQGISEATFCIGGSMGLCQDVLNRADYRLSFSAFTFPHQLMRLILLEQLYRACKINAGETYHK